MSWSYGGTPPPRSGGRGMPVTAQLLEERISMYISAMDKASALNNPQQSSQLQRDIQLLVDLMEKVSSGTPVSEAEVPPPLDITPQHDVLANPLGELSSRMAEYHKALYYAEEELSPQKTTKLQALQKGLQNMHMLQKRAQEGFPIRADELPPPVTIPSDDEFDNDALNTINTRIAQYKMVLDAAEKGKYSDKRRIPKIQSYLRNLEFLQTRAKANRPVWKKDIPPEFEYYATEASDVPDKPMNKAAATLMVRSLLLRVNKIIFRDSARILELECLTKSLHKAENSLNKAPQDVKQVQANLPKLKEEVERLEKLSEQDVEQSKHSEEKKEWTRKEDLLVVETRINEYKNAAMTAKREQRVEDAIKHFKVLKGLHPLKEALERGGDVDMTLVPPPPPILTPVRDTARSSPPPAFSSLPPQDNIPATASLSSIPIKPPAETPEDRLAKHLTNYLEEGTVAMGADSPSPPQPMSLPPILPSQAPTSSPSRNIPSSGSPSTMFQHGGGGRPISFDSIGVLSCDNRASPPTVSNTSSIFSTPTLGAVDQTSVPPPSNDQKQTVSSSNTLQQSDGSSMSNAETITEQAMTLRSDQPGYLIESNASEESDVLDVSNEPGKDKISSGVSGPWNMSDVSDSFDVSSSSQSYRSDSSLISDKVSEAEHHLNSISEEDGTITPTGVMNQGGALSLGKDPNSTSMNVVSSLQQTEEKLESLNPVETSGPENVSSPESSSASQDDSEQISTQSQDQDLTHLSEIKENNNVLAENVTDVEEDDVQAVNTDDLSDTGMNGDTKGVMENEETGSSVTNLTQTISSTSPPNQSPKRLMDSSELTSDQSVNSEPQESVNVMAEPPSFEQSQLDQSKSDTELQSDAPASILSQYERQGARPKTVNPQSFLSGSFNNTDASTASTMNPEPSTSVVDRGYESLPFIPPQQPVEQTIGPPSLPIYSQPDAITGQQPHNYQDSGIEGGLSNPVSAATTKNPNMYQVIDSESGTLSTSCDKSATMNNSYLSQELSTKETESTESSLGGPKLDSLTNEGQSVNQPSHLTAGIPEVSASQQLRPDVSSSRDSEHSVTPLSVTVNKDNIADKRNESRTSSHNTELHQSAEKRASEVMSWWGSDQPSIPPNRNPFQGNNAPQKDGLSELSLEHVVPQSSSVNDDQELEDLMESMSMPTPPPTTIATSIATSSSQPLASLASASHDAASLSLGAANTDGSQIPPSANKTLSQPSSSLKWQSQKDNTYSEYSHQLLSNNFVSPQQPPNVLASHSVIDNGISSSQHRTIQAPTNMTGSLDMSQFYNAGLQSQQLTTYQNNINVGYNSMPQSLNASWPMSLPPNTTIDKSATKSDFSMNALDATLQQLSQPPLAANNNSSGPDPFLNGGGSHLQSYTGKSAPLSNGVGSMVTQRGLMTNGYPQENGVMDTSSRSTAALSGGLKPMEEQVKFRCLENLKFDLMLVERMPYPDPKLVDSLRHQFEGIKKSLREGRRQIWEVYKLCVESELHAIERDVEQARYEGDFEQVQFLTLKRALAEREFVMLRKRLPEIHY